MPADLAPMTPTPYRVDWRRRDLTDTVTLGLVPVDVHVDAIGTQFLDTVEKLALADAKDRTVLLLFFLQRAQLRRDIARRSKTFTHHVDQA